MKKVPMMMKKNEERRGESFLFPPRLKAVVIFISIDINIELKRLTLVRANFKRKTFAFSRRRATPVRS